MGDEARTGTIAGEVPAVEEGPRRVAPTTGQERATLRRALRVVACWRLNDHMFPFGSSFVSPDLAAEMPRLEALLKTHPDSPTSLFGHADPTGDDDANQVLSGRRARSIYALLTRKPEIWEELFSNPVKQDDWGNRSIQLMLSTVTRAPGDAGTPTTDDQAAVAAALGARSPYYEGPITTNRTERTAGAIRLFQNDNALQVDGIAGPNTRRVLFQEYMDAVCANESGVAFSIPPTRFLGKGNDTGGHADFQACSEFNPVLSLSLGELQAFEQSGDKTARNAENATNRRVMLFFFDPATQIRQSEWPCPRISEGSAPCKALFWPDGEKRRSPGSTRRKFSDTADTFACRFYESLARRSPCEGVVQRRLELRLFDDQVDPQPVYDAQYRVKLPTGTRVGTASDGFVRLTLSGLPESVEVEWSEPADEPLTASGGVPRFRLKVFVDVDSGDAETNATRRLHNLGFREPGGLSASVREFQEAYGLPETGELDARTEARIQQVHDSAEPDPVVTPDEEADVRS